jgi:hypothetical protein
MGVDVNSRHRPLLIVFGIYFQAWGGYLILRGLHGHDVFTGDISYIIGSIGIVVFGLGLFLLWFDLIGFVMNLLSKERGPNEIALTSNNLLLDCFIVDAAALFCVAVIIAIIGVLISNALEALRPIHRQFRRKPAPSQPLS